MCLKKTLLAFLSHAMKENGLCEFTSRVFYPLTGIFGFRLLSLAEQQLQKPEQLDTRQGGSVLGHLQIQFGVPERE